MLLLRAPRQLFDALVGRAIHCLSIAIATLLLVAGCATASNDSQPVPNIAGTWVGHLSVTSGILELGGATSGEARLTIEQQGNRVTATIVAPGLDGSMYGRLRGNELIGTGTGTTPQGGATVGIQGKIIGDRFEGMIDVSTLTLQRVGSLPTEPRRKMVERAPQGTLDDELQRLSNLKAQGQITQEEHALLRKRLIETYPVGRGLGRVATAKSKEPIGVTGVWKGDWSTREGNRTGTILLDLKQEGTKITGTVGVEVPLVYPGGGTSDVWFQYTEERIKNGKMKGRILTFEVSRGTQPMRGRLVVKGSSMRGTLENLAPAVQAGEAVLKRE